MGEKPKVSIGIPVYNGENYLSEAIQSILNQTYSALELIITDNASTDHTREIALEHAKKDSRVRYVANERNLGCTGNFNRVFHLAQGEYFKWAPHDDLYEPTFVEKCVQVLDQNPEVVLAHSLTSIIDGEGKFVKHYDVHLSTDQDNRSLRFRSQLRNFLVYEIYGLIRTEALRKTPLFGGFGHEDGILLAHLSLMGKFYEIPEYLYLNREHDDKSWNFYKNYRDYTVWLDPSKAGKILLPRWRMGYEYVRAIVSVPMSHSEHLSCLFEMFPWIGMVWKSLLANLVIAFGQLITLPVRKVRAMMNRSATQLEGG